MTLITRVPGTPDPTLPPVVPSFGLALDHFWHPRTYTAGAAAWRDSIGSIDLPVFGTAADIGKPTAASGRPLLHLTDTASLRHEAVADTEIRTVILIAQPLTSDAGTGATMDVLNVGNSAIRQALSADVAVPTNPATDLPAARDAWHMYACVNPASLIYEFAVDGATAVRPTVGPGANTALRIGTNGSTTHRALTIAGIAASRTAYAAADLAAEAFPAIRAWFNDLF